MIDGQYHTVLTLSPSIAKKSKGTTCKTPFRQYFCKPQGDKKSLETRGCTISFP